MPFNKLQDFLAGLIGNQAHRLFSPKPNLKLDDLLEKLMGLTGEISALITAREILDRYYALSPDDKVKFFLSLEKNFGAKPELISQSFDKYSKDPSSENLNNLYKDAEPKRIELLRRLNQTPNATHDLVAMRVDLLAFIKDYPNLKVVDGEFRQLFSSWFTRSFLTLSQINWSTSAEVLERIIRYEAVHEIKDWDDLRNRIHPPNRRCFAFFHPALINEPLIFVEVALTNTIPKSISDILEDPLSVPINDRGYTTATFYSISNCQPGLTQISFGNFLIKQVVQELALEFPSIKNFVTLSPVPGFSKWLRARKNQASSNIASSNLELSDQDAKDLEIEQMSFRKLVFNYLLTSKKNDLPADPVCRFHLGNGASIYEINENADLSSKGMSQSYGVMVNYLYDLSSIERNHEDLFSSGKITYRDKLSSLLDKDLKLN
ncbi:malonyl-CoA decarboxylase [OM182 bacterium]|jgi:malonyl-CoA decarboxylase|nr:malonyl-CoA decarboxylase [OM182 bacterium]